MGRRIERPLPEGEAFRFAQGSPAKGGVRGEPQRNASPRPRKTDRILVTILQHSHPNQVPAGISPLKAAGLPGHLPHMAGKIIRLRSGPGGSRVRASCTVLEWERLSPGGNCGDMAQVGCKQTDSRLHGGVGEAGQGRRQHADGAGAGPLLLIFSLPLQEPGTPPDGRRAVSSTSGRPVSSPMQQPP